MIALIRNENETGARRIPFEATRPPLVHLRVNRTVTVKTTPRGRPAMINGS